MIFLAPSRSYSELERQYILEKMAARYSSGSWQPKSNSECTVSSLTDIGRAKRIFRAGVAQLLLGGSH
jgi:hypothetical protein